MIETILLIIGLWWILGIIGLFLDWNYTFHKSDWLVIIVFGLPIGVFSFLIYTITKNKKRT